MKQYTLFSYFLCSIFSIAGMNGCVMKNLHDNSLVDLRNKTAGNYSQQVVDAIAGMLDRSELPIMLTVEGGNSVWNPKYDSQLGLSINPPWSAKRTVINPGFLNSETMVDTVQFNDFGSAATYRANILYTFLCFPYNIEELQLPHGMLYTIVNIQESKKGLDFPVQLNNGDYIGIPQEKRKDFLLFVNDVLNWTRHANPHLLDLGSTAGISYMFLLKYYDNLLAIYQAHSSQNGLQELIKEKEKALQESQDHYKRIQQDAITSTNPSMVLPTVLNLTHQDILSQEEALNQYHSQLGTVESQLQSSISENHSILLKLERAIDSVQMYDPDVQGLDTKEVIHKLSKRVDDILAGDETIISEIKKYLHMSGSGLDADESIDDLYRERFERLPPETLDSTMIRLN